MSEQHTPEPWISNGLSIKQDFQMIGLGPESGQTIACVMGGDKSGPHFVESNTEVEANARRIVACVNACAGIPTDDLEQCPSGGLFHLADHANELVKQREELLAALEAVNESAVCFAKNEYSISAYAISKVEDAIASVKANTK